MIKISVIGAGSWGTTIARELAHKEEVLPWLWVYEKEVLEEIKKYRQNVRYLAGVTLPEKLQCSLSLKEVIEDAEIIFIAVPSHVVRSMMEKMKPFLKNQPIVVSLTKGIENDTLKRMSEVIHEVGGIQEDQIVVLSGPSHAEEVSRNIPTAVVAASKNSDAAQLIQRLLSTGTFRVYFSDDVIGAEIGGAVKNVIAIASGICDGIGFGDNTKAALITRGLAEISRLGVALGARAETFAGLSGLGDLVVTCMSKHSRNRYVGEEIAKGKTLEEVISHMNMVAEGVKTTKSVFQLKEKLHIEMPISQKVYEVLFDQKDPLEAVTELMIRDLKREHFGM